MRNVVFVAPFLMDATIRFVRAAAALEGARTVLVTQEPAEKMPQDLRDRLHGHWHVENALDPRQLAGAVTEIARRLGNVSRVIGTLEQLQVPLGTVRDELGIDGMGAAAAENFRDKGRMKDVLRAAGVPCARHAAAGTADEVRAFVRATGYPIVLKPTAGAGAKSTYRVDNDTELEATLRVIPPHPQRPVQAEEFVVGEESSFDTVCLRGAPVWHSLSHYRPTPLEVLRNPWIQWCVFVPREIDDARYDDIRSVAFRALAALGMGSGVSHMEWFRRRDGSLAVGEVGCRPPGAQFCTLHSYAHDFDFYGAWARAAVFDTFDAPQRRYACGAAYLRGQGNTESGRVAAIRGLEQAQKELGSLVVEAKLPRTGQSPSGGYEGEGYVILRHPETSVVEAGLRRLVSLVHVELR